MGRKKTNAVFRHVELLECGKKSKCKVENCGKILHTQHGSNLLHHMKLYHKKEYEEIEAVNNTNKILSSSTPEQRTTQAVLKECTNLVTVHGLPFQVMNYNAFQNILALIPNNSATISAHTLKQQVQDAAAEARYKLAGELRDKLISLKVDIASMSTRSFFGVNVQFIKDGQVVLRNLGVVEIFERHTAEHLKEILIRTLMRFMIENNKIYCITTDNGANVLKMSRLIALDNANIHSNVPQLDANVSLRSGSTILTDTDDESEGEPDGSAANHFDPNQMENAEMNGFVEEELLRGFSLSLRTHFDQTGSNELHNLNIGVVRCAAHTLQLATQNACDEYNFHPELISARNAVKRLRSQNLVAKLRTSHRNIPKLDCTTRWHSSLDMVESLISLKDFCAQDDVCLNLPSSTWDQLDIFVKSMQPPKELTKIIQKEQLTTGDFYLAWISCLFKLEELNTTLSNLVAVKMKERESLLFENECFIAGLFLDPRVNSLLTAEKKESAKKHLISLYIHMQNLRKQSEENHDPIERPTAGTAINLARSRNHTHTRDVRRSDQSRLDAFLANRYIEAHDDINTLLRRSDSQSEFKARFMESCVLFFEEAFVESSVNILAWWEGKKEKYPTLYKLANIVLAAPMTQVSVERLFSSLKFVVSQRRLSLKHDIIEDILFVRSNELHNK